MFAIAVVGASFGTVFTVDIALNYQLNTPVSNADSSAI